MLDTLFIILLFTVPSYDANTVWIPPWERDTFEDSVQVTCDISTVTTNDIDSVYVYAIPNIGNWGTFRKVREFDVKGKEGQADSVSMVFPGWSAAHFYVTFIDTSGNESCASDVVFKSNPMVPTGVEPITVGSVVENSWFDVRGRKLKSKPSASGIYWQVTKINNKIIKVRKVVILK